MLISPAGSGSGLLLNSSSSNYFDNALRKNSSDNPMLNKFSLVSCTIVSSLKRYIPN